MRIRVRELIHCREYGGGGGRGSFNGCDEIARDCPRLPEIARDPTSSLYSARLMPLEGMESMLRRKRSLERCRTQSSCMNMVRRSLRCVSA